ncbi:MAG: diguanylate cyclase [Phycisphaerae bacterium]
MGVTNRLLVIGPAELRDAAVAALPGCDISLAEHPLDGLWRGGKEDYDAVLISLSIGARAMTAGRNLRKVSPQMRIIVSCPPPDEPIARRALDDFADEYLLEPLDPREVANAVHGLAVDASVVAQLGECADWLPAMLRAIPQGPVACAERLAATLRHALGAGGVRVELRETAATDGVVSEPQFQHVIYADRLAAGRVIVSGSHHAATAETAAKRIDEHLTLALPIIEAATEQQRWRELAYSDDLSGLRNRRYFEVELDRLLAQASEQRLRLTVLMFDIDNFKAYNDRHGHDVGDALIREVATLLTRCTRERDVVTRFGGDEFVVIFWDSEKPRQPGSQHPREPIALAERFCQVIASHQFKCLGGGAPGPLTISGGLACFPWNGTTRDQLLKAADDALLAAKRTGKNRMFLAGDAEMQSSTHVSA